MIDLFHRHVVPLALAVAALSACPRQSGRQGPMTTAPVGISDVPEQGSKKGGDYSLGVPVCDDFFQKYEKCITEKAPQENRQAQRLVYEKTVEQVHLQYEKDRESVSQLCRKLRDDLKLALSSYACAW